MSKQNDREKNDKIGVKTITKDTISSEDQNREKRTHDDSEVREEVYKVEQQTESKDVAGRITDVLKLTLLLGTILAVIVGAAFADKEFEKFGLKFYEYAELDDYVRIALRHWIIPFLTVFLMISSWRFSDKLQNSTGWSMKFLGFIMYIAIPFAMFVFGFIRYNSIVEEGVAQRMDGIGDQYTVFYGKNGDSLDCVSYLTKTGNLTHFWHPENKSLNSINSSQMLKMTLRKTNCKTERIVEAMKSESGAVPTTD